MTAYACSIVDPTIHGTTFPATYVAPGNLQFLGVGSTQGSTSGTLSTTAAGTLQVVADTGNTYTLLAANCRAVGGEGNSGIAGAFTQAGTAVDVFVPVGFYPTKVELNVALSTTEVGFYQWMHGMGVDMIASLVAADEASTATAVISVVADADGGDGNVCYVKFPAALVVASQLCCFRILA